MYNAHFTYSPSVDGLVPLWERKPEMWACTLPEVGNAYLWLRVPRTTLQAVVSALVKAAYIKATEGQLGN